LTSVGSRFWSMTETRLAWLLPLAPETEANEGGDNVECES